MANHEKTGVNNRRTFPTDMSIVPGARTYTRACGCVHILGFSHCIPGSCVKSDTVPCD